MLVLQRANGEQVVCVLPDGNEITVTLIHQDGRTRIGIDAPKSVRIWRKEIQPKWVDSHSHLTEM